MADSGTPSPPVARPTVTEGAGLFPPYAILACSVVFFWSISIRSLIFTVMPTLAGDLNLSNSAAGLAIAAMLLGNSLAQWLSGWLPGGRRARVLGGLLLSFLGAVLFSTASDVRLLLAAGLMVGLGVGCYLPLGLALIVEVGGPRRKAWYMSIHEVSATLAAFAGSIFVAVAVAMAGWRGSILLWCIVGSLAFLAFTPVADSRSASGARHRAGAVPLTRTIVYSVVAFGATTVLLSGLISVLPLIMVRAWGLDQEYAAYVIGYTRLAGLAGVAVAGTIADRLGHGRVVLGSQLLSLVGGVAMSFGGYGPAFLAGVLLMAAGTGATIVLVPIVIAAAYSPAQRERSMAVSSGFGSFFGTVVSPAVFGFLIDLGLATGPIILSTAMTLMSVVATRRIRGPGARE